MEGPGVGQPKYKDLDKLADQYVDVRDEKAALATKLGKIEGQIVDKMIEKGIRTYRFSDQEVTIKPGTTHIKIKTVKVDTASNGAGEAGEAE